MSKAQHSIKIQVPIRSISLENQRSNTHSIVTNEHQHRYHQEDPTVCLHRSYSDHLRHSEVSVPRMVATAWNSQSLGKITTIYTDDHVTYHDTRNESGYTTIDGISTISTSDDACSVFTYLCSKLCESHSTAASLSSSQRLSLWCLGASKTFTYEKCSTLRHLPLRRRLLLRHHLRRSRTTKKRIVLLQIHTERDNKSNGSQQNKLFSSLASEKWISPKPGKVGGSTSKCRYIQTVTSIFIVKAFSATTQTQDFSAPLSSNHFPQIMPISVASEMYGRAHSWNSV